MITELYAIDRQLVDNLIENVVTIEIQSLSGKTWVSAVLPSENIVSESLEIRQSICDSEELQIGGCIPSQLTLDVMNTGDLSGKRIIVKIRTRYYSDVLFPSASLYPSTSLYPNAATQPEELSTDDYAVFAGTIFLSLLNSLPEVFSSSLYSGSLNPTAIIRSLSRIISLPFRSAIVLAIFRHLW